MNIARSLPFAAVMVLGLAAPVLGAQTRARLDKNNSGVVEGYEWPYNADIFRQLDTNGDNVLETKELDHINSSVMVQLDRNHNSKIDDNEWPRGFAKFEQLDQNGDGRVSSQEYFERGGEWQRRSRFDHWDTNQDSTISSSEWKSSATLFHKLDKNGDARIDWNEFKADEGRYYARPYGSRY
jgi:Ca2+-binding EF-hand superfamily protein